MIPTEKIHCAALYGKEVEPEHLEQIRCIISVLKKNEINVFVHESMYLSLERFDLAGDAVPYKDESNAASNVQLIISIGGDGTFLNAAKFAVSASVPIIGLNTGRLGFLARISKNELESVLQNLLSGNYRLEKRALIELNSEPQLFGNQNFALNEFTVHKNDSSSMITVKTKLNGEFLNSYWADGLIISTPTGSTAYSMSCGGPIVMPGSNNFIITPVAPHNLNVRPLVIPDDSEIELTVEGRGKNCIVSLDSQLKTHDLQTVFKLRRHKKNLKFINLPGHSHLKTLRNKLNWGLDQRN